MMITRKSNGVAWGAGWHFPVPDLITRDGQRYDAVVSSGVRHPKRPGHHGIDVLYRRKRAGDRPEYKAGTPDGDETWFAPPETPILAARAGKVWSVTHGPKGWAVVIDHGKPWATFYQHLARVDLEPHTAGKAASGGPPTVVKEGDMIGTMGFSTTDPARLRHLHFEAWFNGHGNAASQDPAVVIGQWGRSQWRI